MLYVFLFLRFCVALFVLGVALTAILAVLGFAVAEFDVFNHLQVFIFPAALIGLILAALLFREGRIGLFLIAFSATGFIASASVFLPEVVSGMLPRAALPTDGRPLLKAMTQNVFGLNYDMQRVADAVFAEDPDVLAVQEYFPSQRRLLHPLLVGRYSHFVYCTGGKRANIGLYAKQPFTAIEEGACSERATPDRRTSRIIATFTLPDGTRYSVLTTHLDWPVPIKRQRAQLDELAAAIDGVNGPLIVMGDMNTTSWSYGLRGLVSRTGMERHTRNLVTFPMEFLFDRLMMTFPFLPLDQVMSKNGIAVHELHSGPDTGSDHLPVAFTFSVEPAPEPAG